MKDNTKYEVIRVHIESMSFDVMILKLPENELDDRLTYLTRDKGLIEKSKFDDFLIATCITNVNAVVEYLQQTKVTLDQVNAIRLEMVDNIIKVNPLLDPNNMVINKNNVVKISKRNNKSLKKLTDNELWMSDIYATPTMDNSKLSDIPHVSYDQEDTTKNKKVDTSKIRNLKDISYVPIQKFWKRLGQYVTIKQFSEIDADVITGGREFPTLASYRQYIVTVCVEDIEDLFQKLDQLGLPKRVPSQDLIYELYDLCIISNQFLAPDATKPSCESDIFNQQKTATSDKGLPENTENTAKVKLFKQVKKETLLGLSSEMKTKVIGQDQALDTLVEAIQRASVGLKDPDHPLGAFVFAGYSGTGKTHTAKVLAELLTGSGRGLVSVDCSEYSSDHEYSKLIGAPSGYIGYEQGGYLTNAIKKQPFSVVLFDEIEKASDKVHQLLLQVMDEARLTDGKGHPVSFKDTIIIMTSNIGVKEVDAIGKTIGFGDANVITNDKRTQAVESALKNQFKPEFLNRLTSIINFNSLTKENYLQIIKLELEKLKLNLKLSGTEYSQTRLKFDESLLEYIYGKGIDESYGARPLKRYIEQEVSTPLARKLLQEPIPEMSMVFVSIKDGTLSIDVVKGQDDVPNNPPFYMGNSAGECQGEQTNV
jgi:hypothetical protein